MQITKEMVDKAKATAERLWDEMKATDEKHAAAVAEMKAAGAKWHEAYRESELFERMFQLQSQGEQEVKP